MNETTEGKQTRANQVVLRGARVSPLKVRPVIDLVRNKSVAEALDILQFTPKKAAGLVIGMIESALANIGNSNQLTDWDADDLYIGSIYVNEGPTMRRFRPRAQGRATRIMKRTSHITVILVPKSNVRD